MAKIRMSTRDTITLTTLFLMTTILFADQMIMSAIIPELCTEYGASATTIGLIGSAFTLLGAVVSIIFGYMSDTANRKYLLVFVILLGEIPCILTGVRFFTPTIEAFTALRILAGLGLGAVYPVSNSILADYFKEEHRATASAWITVAWSLGAMLGISLAGYLTPSFGWRLAFVLIGIPNIPLAIFFALYAKDPERGRTEDALEDLIQKGLVYKPKIKLRDFAVIFTNKTNLFTFLAGLPGTIPWGIFSYWGITFFQQYRHVSKEMATTIFLVLGIGATIGSVVFAYIGERLYKKNPMYMPILCGCGILAGFIPSIILINLSLANISKYLVLSFLTGFLVAVAMANVKAILMNVNRPEHRGTVFSVFNITDNIGMGLGPAIGGLLLPFGYAFMMNFAIIWWVPGGLLLFLVAKTINQDREALRAFLDLRAAEMSQAQGGANLSELDNVRSIKK